MPFDTNYFLGNVDTNRNLISFHKEWLFQVLPNRPRYPPCRSKLLAGKVLPTEARNLVVLPPTMAAKKYFSG